MSSLCRLQRTSNASNYTLLKSTALVFLLAFGLLWACQPTFTQDAPDAQTLVDAAIEAHGGTQYDYALVEFDFRDKHYRARQQGGAFQYQRIFTEDGRSIRDQLDNDGFTRQVDGDPVTLVDSLRDAYRSSVNSVIYFALLPHGLNDPAVNKRYLREVELDGQPYHEVEVTFRQRGGGEDYQDEFRYYFHPETHHLDYLAYAYATNGGGIRFRSRYQPRRVQGIRFQDYVNFKADPATMTLDDLPDAFNAGKLEELSRIELENVAVQPLPRPEQLLP